MRTCVSGLVLAVTLSVFAQGQEAPRRYFSGIALDLGKDTPWVARHEMTSESYAAEFQKWTRQGYRLYCVTASPRLPNHRDVRFAAVWIPDNTGTVGGQVIAKSRLFEAHHDHDQEEFRRTLAKIKGVNKMRPWHVTGYIDAGRDRVASIFVNDSVTDWFADSDLTDAQFQQALSQWQAKGYRPTRTTGYATVAGTRFALVMVKDDKVKDWEARRNLTQEQYQQEFAKWTGQGYTPAEVCGYPLNGGVRFAGLFIKDPAKPRASTRHGISEQEYQTWIKSIEKDKLVPVYVSVCSIGGTMTTAGTSAEAPISVGPSPISVTPASTSKAWIVCTPVNWVQVNLDAGLRWFGRDVPGMREAPETKDSLTAMLKKHGFETQNRGVEGTGGSIKLQLFARLNYETRTANDRVAERLNREVKAIADMVYGGAKGVGKRVYVTRMTGVEVPLLALFDDAMQKYMSERGITAGTLAVSLKGRLVFVRGYGHLDRDATIPCGPSTPMRIASVTKPITAAAVRKLIRDGKLRADTKIVDYLGIKPPKGKTLTSGWSDITVAHLMEHKGGWNRDTVGVGDPMYQSKEIAKALGITGPPSAGQVITYMAGQPLQFTPGTQSVYSNFGYCVLGRVIEKASGKTYVDYIRSDITGPLNMSSIALGRSLPALRNPIEPVYVDAAKGPNVMQPSRTEQVPMPDGGFHLEATDAHGGLIASAPDLLKFIQAYWLDGQPRQKGVVPPNYSQFKGDQWGNLSIVRQRVDDGVDIVALFNQRTGYGRDDEIFSLLDAAANKIRTWPDEILKIRD